MKKKVVGLVVALTLFASASEARAQGDQVVLGIFPNGAVFVIRVHQDITGTFAGAGMIFLPMNGLQNLRVDVGADIPGGGVILVGRTQTPVELMAIVIDASNNLSFLYFGVVYGGTGLIIAQ